MNDTIAEMLAAHRPYGLDCKCGEPINSDAGWARHVAKALGVFEDHYRSAMCPDDRDYDMVRWQTNWRPVDA